MRPSVRARAAEIDVLRIEVAIRIDEPGAVRLTVTGHEVGPTELEGPHVKANECPILTG